MIPSDVMQLCSLDSQPLHAPASVRCSAGCAPLPSCRPPLPAALPESARAECATSGDLSNQSTQKTCPTGHGSSNHRQTRFSRPDSTWNGVRAGRLRKHMQASRLSGTEFQRRAGPPAPPSQQPRPKCCLPLQGPLRPLRIATAPPVLAPASPCSRQAAPRQAGICNESLGSSCPPCATGTPSQRHLSGGTRYKLEQEAQSPWPAAPPPLDVPPCNQGPPSPPQPTPAPRRRPRLHAVQRCAHLPGAPPPPCMAQLARTARLLPGTQALTQGSLQLIG